ncbi:hypothetical protein LEP3755_30810 [Leptolyngbya sp. NIES-3755]|nr:hypothetical protein LEP3755_30810 [Leptolyngbya sp. NIES-3755]
MVQDLRSSKLFDQAQDLMHQLGESGFEKRKHQWSGTAGHKRGSCTFHHSKSNSAWLSNQSGKVTFHCPTCTGGKPLDVFGYWLSDRYGYIIDQCPRGKEWVELAKQFLFDHGITPIEQLRPHSRQHFKICTDAKPSQSESSDRDLLIQERHSRFLTYWKKLQNDFLLLKIVNNSTVRFVQYEGYAPSLDLFSDTTFLQGWLGTGKTETILKSLKEQFSSHTVVWVAPRNGLFKQTAERAKQLGFDTYHYQDDAALHRRMLLTQQAGIYLLSPDSFKVYAVGNMKWENAILVFDEFSGIRKELLHKTSEYPQVLDAIKRCNMLIVADAFLSQIDTKVIQKIRPADSEDIISQKFSKSSVKISWIETRNKAGDISFDHSGSYYELLDRWIEQKTHKIAIATDSVLIAKLLNRYLQAKGVRTWLVCSETPEENSSFMPDPNSVIRDGKIEAVIYTPTAQSGLDIQSKFDRGLLISTGVLPPTQMLQMAGRCRHCLEWFVSAPRRSNNFTTIAPSLNGKKVQRWAEDLKQLCKELELCTDSRVQTWAIWERLVQDIEKAFNSEYLQELLQYFFESVTTVELSSNRIVQWRRDADALKSEEAEQMLNANLQSGLLLLDAQKQPVLNSQVWEIKLVELSLKYAKPIEKLLSAFNDTIPEITISNGKLKKLGSVEAVRERLKLLESDTPDFLEAIEYHVQEFNVATRIYAEEQNSETELRVEDAEKALTKARFRLTENQGEIERLSSALGLSVRSRQANAIKLIRLFSSSRLERLKNWVMANEANEQDDRDLIAYLQQRSTHCNASKFKLLQNLELFRSLKLDRLAVIRNDKEAQANVTAFRCQSPIISEIWLEFCQNPKLMKLFPTVNSQYESWLKVKACLAYFGYQKRGKRIRITTGTSHPNGKYRNGEKRSSNSQSLHFVYWFVMEASGSALFQQNFDLIIEAIRDRLVVEREERRKWKEKGPPPDWGAT